MDHLLDLYMYVLVRKKYDLLSESLERSTRGTVTKTRQRKPLLFKQTLRSRFTSSRVYKSCLFQTIRESFKSARSLPFFA